MGSPGKPQEGRQRRCKSRTATQDFQAIRALQFRANVLEVHGVLGVADDDLLTILRWRRQIAGLAGDDLCPTVFEKVFYVGRADRLKGIFSRTHSHLIGTPSMYWMPPRVKRFIRGNAGA